MEQRFVPSPIIDFHVQTTLTSPTAPTHAPSPAAFDTAQAIDPPALDIEDISLRSIYAVPTWTYYRCPGQNKCRSRDPSDREDGCSDL